MLTESNMNRVEQDSEQVIDSVIGSQSKSIPRRSSAKLIGDGFSNKHASVIDTSSVSGAAERALSTVTMYEFDQENIKSFVDGQVEIIYKALYGDQEERAKT